MLVKDFNAIYNNLTKCKKIDVFLMVNGWFWLQVTEKQHRKMYKLLQEKGNKESVNKRGQKCIEFSNGLQVLKI